LYPVPNNIDPEWPRYILAKLHNLKKN
jgi:hypothetical protein